MPNLSANCDSSLLVSPVSDSLHGATLMANLSRRPETGVNLNSGGFGGNEQYSADMSPLQSNLVLRGPAEEQKSIIG